MDSTLQKVRGLTKEPIETISTNPTYGKFEHGDALDKITQEVRVKLEEELDEESLKVLPKAVGMVRKQEDRRWQTTLPDDILSNISDLLPLSDFINFRGVCRNWRRVPSCRSNITELSKKDPWCILYNFDARDKDMCLFYQWNRRKSCNVKLPGLRGAKCFVSKRGWLFIRRNNDYLLFNPLTLEEIFLPDFPVKSFGSSTCQVGTFSGSPSSPLRCIVVLMSSRDSSTVRIDSCRLAANKWVVTTIRFDTRDVECDSCFSRIQDLVILEQFMMFPALTASTASIASVFAMTNITWF